MEIIITNPSQNPTTKGNPKRNNDVLNETKLSLYSDVLHNIPPWILDIKKLEYLKIKGSSWDQLTMENIPKTVQWLEFVEQHNLNPQFCDHMETLVKLKFISIDINCIGITIGFNNNLLPFFVYHNISSPFINNLSLCTIVLDLSRQTPFNGKDLLKFSNVKEELLNFEMFKNIKHRINNIKFIYKETDDKDFISIIEYIIIELKK